MDTGGRQALPDVLGKTVYTRNSRGFVLRTEYDALRRPLRTYVAGPGITGVALQGRTEYGESATDPEARNLRTREIRQFDGGGIATSSAYDFKGNLLGSLRQLAAEYASAVVDWTADVPLEDREYRANISYDALNRPVSMTTPDRHGGDGRIWNGTEAAYSSLAESRGTGHALRYQGSSRAAENRRRD